MSGEVDGVERLRRKLKALSKGMEKLMVDEVQKSAIRIQSGAKDRVPVDEGRLRNSIDYEMQGIDARVGTNLVYARAIEFGLPPGYLKAPPPAKAFEGWVRRVLGITDPDEVENVARAIAWKVYRHGTEAQPYLLPAFDEEKPQLRKRLNRRINEFLKDVGRDT